MMAWLVEVWTEMILNCQSMWNLNQHGCHSWDCQWQEVALWRLHHRCPQHGVWKQRELRLRRIHAQLQALRLLAIQPLATMVSEAHLVQQQRRPPWHRRPLGPPSA